MSSGDRSPSPQFFNTGSPVVQLASDSLCSGDNLEFLTLLPPLSEYQDYGHAPLCYFLLALKNDAMPPSSTTFFYIVSAFKFLGFGPEK